MSDWVKDLHDKFEQDKRESDRRWDKWEADFDKNQRRMSYNMLSPLCKLVHRCQDDR